MKKLIVLASVCAMALASQAYDFKWGVTNVRVPEAADPHKSETGIKVTTSSPAFGGDYGSLTLQLYVLGGEEVGRTLVGEKTASSASVTAYTIFTDSSDIYTKLVDDLGDTAKPQFELVAQYKTADGVYDFSGTYTATKTLADLSKGNVTLGTSMTGGTWNYTANAVPEPTSGLLLLLGVAGLALRRRRA